MPRFMSSRAGHVVSGIAATELAYPGNSGVRALRVYRPQIIEQRHLALVVFLHGGDFVSGSLDDATPAAAELARRLEAVVVTPDYTLASERPFPEAAEDAYAAIAWTHDNATLHGGDARRIAVAGEEAGGNLAAVAALMARDRGGPALTAQVLVSPMLDPTLTSCSMRNAKPAAGTHALDCFIAAYRRYLPKASDQLHPYASPAHCSRLAGVAPALIISAEDDPLRDEAEAYGAALIATGVTTQVSRLKRSEAGARRWSEEIWAAVTAFLAPRLAYRNPY
jgi:acetyl esterase